MTSLAWVTLGTTCKLQIFKSLRCRQRTTRIPSIARNRDTLEFHCPNIMLHIPFSTPNLTISEQNLRDIDRSSRTLDDRLSSPEERHFCSDGGLGGSKLTYSLRYKFLGAIYTAEKPLREHRFPWTGIRVRRQTIPYQSPWRLKSFLPRPNVVISEQN